MFEREWLSAKREQSPFSLILLDIDYFKAYNDNYGHIQGDVTLRQVAQVIKKSLCRPRDVVARFGGEEFAIILPDTDEKGALKIAQMLKQNIQNTNIEHQKSGVSAYLTVSMGVKTARDFDYERIHFLKDVDTALYQSKRNGRNQFICANHEMG